MGNNVSTEHQPIVDGQGVRRPETTYQALLRRDRQLPADDMRTAFPTDLGLGTLSTDRYTSEAFHRLEVERMWRRTWQLACREEEIAAVGDIVVYDLAEHSLLIVRSAPDEIKAFHNSCLHRGTKLCTADTSVSRLRCPYHGFTWSLDGRLAEVPARWDFPQIRDDKHHLPEAKVERWGGFVFINMDRAAAPLEHYLEDIPDHMAHMNFADHYLSGYYRKVLPCNWKAAIEAFIEAYHVAETHPQSRGMADEVCTQYDVLPGRRHTNRNLQPMGVPCATLDPQPTDQAVLDEMYRLMRGNAAPAIPHGHTARTFMAEEVRRGMTEATGHDYTAFSDAETLDNIQYLLFPNMVLFRSLAIPIVYRSRPNGNDPDSCIFDLMLLTRVPRGGPRPDPAAVYEMGSKTFRDVAEFPPFFAQLYDQDLSNLRAQQQGMHASVTKLVELSRYQEVRIRHLHRTLDSYLSDDG